MGDTAVEDRWWYCLVHNRVEHGAGCPNKKRMGPYASEEAASRALTTAAERNSAWEEQDKEDW